VLFPLSIRTILIAHIMFNISFVVVTVKAAWPTSRATRGGGDGPRRERVDDLLEGDVPADPAGILAAALLAFSLSIDDYVVTASRPADRDVPDVSSTARSCAASPSRST
jgi:spermidine/putrescine transport system permease protein